MHSFLWLNNIPLCICTMYHSFFIHLFINGHLGCFHILAIVIVLQWRVGYVCVFQLWFPQGIFPVVGLLGHMVLSFLVLKGISILFSLVAVSPTPVFFPGESQGWRSLVGYSPWGRKESDTTERLLFFTKGYIKEFTMLICILKL